MLLSQNRTVIKFGRGTQMGRTAHVAARNCSCHTACVTVHARTHRAGLPRPSRLDAIDAHSGANVLPMQLFAYDFV